MLLVFTTGIANTKMEIPINPIPKVIIDACANFGKELLVEYITTNEIKYEE